ncbi:MAG TPA: flagellin [Dehalococcoidales bacterium]|nr:flagellin [Dehalococcoidales bacterium]
MRKRFLKVIARLHRGQRGMTGLETAIILIAFVTVASVLAYSVLSAGIFAAERGKATVYQGLASAQATMSIQGSVLGLSPNGTELEQIQFTVALTLEDESVDMNSVVINYFDTEVHSEDITWTSEINGGCTERGAVNLLEADEQHVVIVTIPDAATIDAYEKFTVQVFPPTGATLSIQRTVPGAIQAVMNLY